MTYLLDTNVISDPLKARPNPGVTARLHRHAGEIAIPAPAWHEFFFGQVRAPRGKTLRPQAQLIFAEYVQSVVGRVPLIVYGADAATWHAKERARLERAGREAKTIDDLVDGMIAAIARIYDLTVVTRNVEDFRPYEGIQIENWFS